MTTDKSTKRPVTARRAATLDDDEPAPRPSTKSTKRRCSE